MSPAIDAVVFWLGDCPLTLRNWLTGHRIEVRTPGSYADLLHGQVGAEFLVHYPLLHKYLVLEHLGDLAPEQVLLVDYDTLFRGDVEGLFDRFKDRDVVGRPESGSRRGPLRYDPAYLDEDRLAEIANGLGAEFVAPINGGVLLFSRTALEKMPVIANEVARLSMRLMVGIVASGAQLTRHELRLLSRTMAAGDETVAGLGPPIDFPTSNHWIVEEVALWLTLGLHPELTVAEFSPHDVALGDEVWREDRGAADWRVGHYFGSGTERALDWWRQQSRMTGRAMRLPIARQLLQSPLLAAYGGFRIYDHLFSQTALDALTAEARAQYRQGREEVVRSPFGDQGRGGHPERRLVVSPGGPVQDALYCASWLQSFLEARCGLPVRPTGRRGCFNHYTRAGDSIGIHLDIDECDLVVLTVLEDQSDPRDPAGAYRVYPDHVGAPLGHVRWDGPAAGKLIKVRPGQSLIMFGGLVPHEVIPVRARQARSVSALCFRAGDPNPSAVGSPT